MNIYEITTRSGRHLCYQVARNEADAVQTARMHGHGAAAFAVLARTGD